MKRSKRVSYAWVCALLLFSVAAACAAQEKGAAPPSPPAAATTPSSPAASQFEVVPGIPLPANGMVWILDQPDNKPHLQRIYLNKALPNGHRAENFARAQLLVLKMASTIDLLGVAAKLRVTSHTPTIFIRKSAEEEEEVESSANSKSVREHYALLHVHVSGDHRVVCSFSAWQLGIKLSRHEDIVDASTEEIASGVWLKITPKKPLPDGEYAVVHLPDDKKMFESNTYDFGVGAAPVPPPANP